MSDNNNSKSFIMGLFTDENRAASAVEELEDSPWKIHKVHTPFPSHKILDALKLKKSRVGYFTLAGGIIGFLFGLFVAAFTSLRWGLIVSGKPIVSLIPYFIVGFEFTILFSVFGNVLGILTQAKLPEFRHEKLYDPRCSGSHYGVVAACEPGESEKLKSFFTEKGAEVRTFG